MTGSGLAAPLVLLHSQPVKRIDMRMRMMVMEMDEYEDEENEGKNEDDRW